MCLIKFIDLLLLSAVFFFIECPYSLGLHILLLCVMSETKKLQRHHLAMYIHYSFDSVMSHTRLKEMMRSTGDNGIFYNDTG